LESQQGIHGMRETSEFSGHCYCGALHYSVSGKPAFKAQCHCRECQYFSGGGPNYFMLLPESGLRWTSGTPAMFARSDIENPVTRSFCGTCGTQIASHLPHGGMIALKVGTLDHPAHYGGPKAAIHTADQQPFHTIPDGLPAFDRLPPR
jgi:hypothetical protein